MTFEFLLFSRSLIQVANVLCVFVIRGSPSLSMGSKSCAFNLRRLIVVNGQICAKNIRFLLIFKDL